MSMIGVQVHPEGLTSPRPSKYFDCIGVSGSGHNSKGNIMTKSNCVDLTNANTQRHVPGEDPMHHDRARGVAVSGGGEDAAMTENSYQFNRVHQIWGDPNRMNGTAWRSGARE